VGAECRLPASGPVIKFPRPGLQERLMEERLLPRRRLTERPFRGRRPERFLSTVKVAWKAG